MSPAHRHRSHLAWIRIGGVIIATGLVFAVCFGVGLVLAEILFPGPWVSTGPTSRAELPGFTIWQYILAGVIALVGTAFAWLVATTIRDEYRSH